MLQTRALCQGLPQGIQRSGPVEGRAHSVVGGFVGSGGCGRGSGGCRTVGDGSGKRRRAGGGFWPRQRVNNVPPLPTSNRFAPLWLDVADTQSTLVTSPQRKEESVTSISKKSYPKRRCRWERKLPHTYVRSVEPGPRSLSLKVEIQATDTGVVKGVTALLDSGATGLFIDRDFVRAQGLTTRTLTHPIPVRNVDGTLNAVGAIQEVVDLILRYKGHAERAIFSVSQLGSQKVILGHTWIRLHNPEIDWRMQEVRMSCCPIQCGACREETRKEREEERRVRVCWAGSPPAFTRTEEEAEESVEGREEGVVEEEDRIYATLLPGEGGHTINATSTTSQRTPAELRGQGCAVRASAGPDTSLPSGLHRHLRQGVL